MNRGICLCGEVSWEVEGPYVWASHCHCSRCRKTHGAAFATYVAASADGFRMRGEENVVNFESSPGFFRCFCGRCGSVVPGPPFEGQVFVPAGNFEDDPEVRPLAHIFVASKAPWYDIRGDLQQFDTYPEGIDAPVLADLEVRAASGPRSGSCLCGGVAFVAEGEALRCHHCHCSRCRRARSAAHASNLMVSSDGLRILRGQELLTTYNLPGALRFAQVFCRRCGSPMPRVDKDRRFAVVPMGALDGDPGVRPQSHIFVGSKAPWFDIADDLPQNVEHAT